MSENNNRENPRVFISYSWDSPEHRLWVESFAQELRKSGIDARLDAWRDESQSIDDFMMIELERADCVIAVCTPQFKQKIVQNAEGVAGTASGFEIGTAAALRRVGGKDVIPVLRAGSWVESAPSSLLSYRYYDFSKDDISEGFAQLRDRLLGHVRRPPELGPRSGPAATPELPDIFAGGAKPKPARKSVPPAERAAPAGLSPGAPRQPSAPQQMYAAPAPARKGKWWIWAAGAVVALVVLWNLVPDAEDGGVLSEDAPETTGFQEEEGVIDDTVEAEEAEYFGEGDAEDQFDATGPAALTPAASPGAAWELLEAENGCYIQKEVAPSSWVQMGIDPDGRVFLVGTYDREWADIEQGKIYKIVYELDDDANLAFAAEAVGHYFGELPGVYITSDSAEFIQGLAQRHLLSMYWNEEPYREYWVMDADLTGSNEAIQRLFECQANL